MTKESERTAPMIAIGVDAHKKTHTLVAVDQVGLRL